MEKLVGPRQCSFVPGRCTADNILVAQEVVHSMRMKKGSKGWMAIKLDLEKVYDRMDQQFICDTLKDANIPIHLIQIVRGCLSTSTTRVLGNGSSTSEFTPSRGVRQGDLVSPYSFVLCLERLSQFIDLLVDNGVWEPIRIARNGPRLSHLCFGDDLILFARASLEHVQVIKEALDILYRSSG